MKKENRVHMTYGLIILVLFFSLFIYENYQTKNTRQALADSTNLLNNKISDLQKKLETDLKASLDKVNKSLEQQGSELATITGDLQQVKVESQQQLGELQEKISKLKAQNQDFSEVIEKAIPAVVSIRTDIGAGSGFLVEENGYTVTNYHVIENARAGTAITSDGARHTIRIVGFNRQADIAVLQLEGNDFATLSWGSSEKMAIGESVIAVGNPGGLDFSVTKGIISAFREDPEGNALIQIDVPINPGNSGGPLINSAGRVIGVNTKKIQGFEGVGFALASDFIEDFVEDIINTDQQPKTS